MIFNKILDKLFKQYKKHKKSYLINLMIKIRTVKNKEEEALE